jgi:hypothetical protein
MSKLRNIYNNHGRDIAAVTGLATAVGLGVWGLSHTGWWNRNLDANITGYSITCVKETGVKYVQFPSGAARLDDKNGKPVPCDP